LAEGGKKWQPRPDANQARVDKKNKNIGRGKWAKGKD